jgi:hypothetical protein
VVSYPPPFIEIPTLIGWDFFARSASVGAVPGHSLLSATFVATPVFGRFCLSVSIFLCAPLEHSRLEVPHWRGFAGDWFAFSIALASATETEKDTKNHPEAACRRGAEANRIDHVLQIRTT